MRYWRVILFGLMWACLACGGSTTDPAATEGTTTTAPVVTTTGAPSAMEATTTTAILEPVVLLDRKLHAVVPYGDRLVGLSGDRLLESADGLSWTEIVSTPNLPVRGVLAASLSEFTIADPAGGLVFVTSDFTDWSLRSSSDGFIGTGTRINPTISSVAIVGGIPGTPVIDDEVREWIGRLTDDVTASETCSIDVVTAGEAELLFNDCEDQTIFVHSEPRESGVSAQSPEFEILRLASRTVPQIQAVERLDSQSGAVPAPTFRFIDQAIPTVNGVLASGTSAVAAFLGDSAFGHRVMTWTEEEGWNEGERIDFVSPDWRFVRDSTPNFVASPDGTILAAANTGLWAIDPVDGSVSLFNEAPTSEVDSIRLTPDGRHALAVEGEGGTVWLAPADGDWVELEWSDSIYPTLLAVNDDYAIMTDGPDVSIQSTYLLRLGG